MWKYSDWNKIIKWGITGAFILFVLIGATNDKKTSTNLPVEEQTVASKTPEPTKKIINYQIFRHWAIPNGGEGKVIVISPDNLNESDMILLGERLKADTANDRNAFIFIFDDKKAAAMRDDLNNLNKADSDFYDRHYVGEYSRNGNSGYHQFEIFFDGVNGTNRKTIKY